MIRAGSKTMMENQVKMSKFKNPTKVRQCKERKDGTRNAVTNVQTILSKEYEQVSNLNSPPDWKWDV